MVEENRAFLEEETLALGIPVDGKERLLRVGELSAGELRRRILHIGSNQKAAAEDTPARPPQFCPGCGHRGIFHLLAKHKIIVNGDIGCYGLAALPPYDAMDTLICMGASIGMNHGMSKTLGEGERAVAVIGDSTFFHSGMTGLANLVHNGGNATTIVLDNRITAMTGHQPSPTTGRRATGQDTAVLAIPDLCRALGVQHIREVDAYDMDAMEQVVLDEIARPEPSVIVVNQRCSIIERKKTGQMYIVNDDCKKCGKCFQLGCPALTKGEAHTIILEDFCDGCGLCAKVCPFGAIVEKETNE